MRIGKVLIAAAMLCAAFSAAAEEKIDRKVMLEMLPCKSAALRLCDRTLGINAAALWACGAMLAGHQHEVGQRCVSVLKRFGQL